MFVLVPFVPELLPETCPPEYAVECNLCELSGQRTRVVWGEGNADAQLFIVLDNPGAREDKEGKPYLCGTRETLLSSIYMAGITPEKIYISYILKCRPVRRYDKPVSKGICIRYLWQQLDSVMPKLLMVLGNTAIQAFSGDETAEVKNLRGSIHIFNGYKTVVSYHPLAVRRRPNLKKNFLDDLRLASSCLNKN